MGVGSNVGPFLYGGSGACGLPCGTRFPLKTGIHA